MTTRHGTGQGVEAAQVGFAAWVTPNEFEHSIICQYPLARLVALYRFLLADLIDRYDDVGTRLANAELEYRNLQELLKDLN